MVRWRPGVRLDTRKDFVMMAVHCTGLYYSEDTKIGGRNWANDGRYSRRYPPGRGEPDFCDVGVLMTEFMKCEVFSAMFFS